MTDLRHMLPLNVVEPIDAPARDCQKNQTTKDKDHELLSNFFEGLPCLDDASIVRRKLSGLMSVHTSSM